MIHVAVVAPVLALRAGLRTLLNTAEKVEVVAEAASLGEALPLPPETDVLLMVVTQPYGLFEELLQNIEPIPVLLLLAGESPPLNLAAGYSAPWGLLPLDVSAEELIAALGALQEGLIVGSPDLLRGTMAGSLPIDPRHDQPINEPFHQANVDELTERELQVLGLLAQGLANKQIAAALGISEHTVKFHVSSIYNKLGVANRTEAVRQGVRLGLILL